MPLLTERKTNPQYDVIVVGSGAGGGMAALILSLQGVKVLMLEAGRNYDPVTETAMFNTPEMAPLRGERTKEKYFGYYDATVGGGWQVPGSLTRTRRARSMISGGGARACWADAPTIGGASPCASAPMISGRIRGTGWEWTGP